MLVINNQSDITPALLEENIFSEMQNVFFYAAGFSTRIEKAV